MAYNFKIEYITTTRRNVVKGLSFPMASGNEGGYFAKSTDKQTLIEGLIQGIKTHKGERVMNPDFGTTLGYRLFNPITEQAKSEIESEIKELIQVYYPRLILSSIRIGSGGLGNNAPGLDSNTLNIQLDIKFKDNIFEEETINVLVE